MFIEFAIRKGNSPEHLDYRVLLANTQLLVKRSREFLQRNRMSSGIAW